MADLVFDNTKIKMQILVLNIGSSTVKYAIFSDEDLKIKGKIERIRDTKGYIRAINQISNVINKHHIKIEIIGHRIVHGGDIKKACFIDKKIKSKIKKYSEFAPLHNPPELIAIDECERLFNVKQVALFDTAFFSNIPEKAFIYGLPYKYYINYGIRKYGFHGISHNYVSIKAGEILNKDIRSLKIITCHLGSGCSISAIKNGVCIDTSMGFTPLEGLVMGTRAGDIDTGAILYLIKKQGLNIKQANKILNKESGLLGISGISEDIRVLLKSKNKRAKLSIDVFTYRITKYIGGYISAMNGADVIVFTGGIGENCPEIRANILSNLMFFGLRLDIIKNNKNKEIITRNNSNICVLVIKTDEELMIAKEVLSLHKC